MDLYFVYLKVIKVFREMKERIKEFIEYKGISAGELATSLDVQRSNISHILNGRNKPGATLIEKLLMAFPDLNARWLLTGEGSMMNTVTLQEGKGEIKQTPPKHANTDNSIIPASAHKNLPNKSVEKVILLYTDGTFSSFSS